VTLDVLEELIRIIVTALLGCILRVHCLYKAASTDTPLTVPGDGSVIGSLREVTVRGIQPLTGVRTEGGHRSDTVGRGRSGEIRRGCSGPRARVFREMIPSRRLGWRGKQY